MKSVIISSILGILIFGNVSFAQYNDDSEEYYEIVYVGPSREIKSLDDFFNYKDHEEYRNFHILVDSGNYYMDDQIIIRGDDLLIEGKGQVNLICNNSLSNVMDLSACYNVKILNFRMVHLAPGNIEFQNCTGRVLGFDHARYITVENCDLNGCGIAGLHDNLGNNNILIKDNYIHNNSEGAYTNIEGEVWQEEIDDHPVFIFENNRMENNGPDRIKEEFIID